MRKNSIQILTMITGILTALIIVFSQFFFFQNATYSKKLVKTEKQEEKKNNDAKTQISLPSFSQSSSAHPEVQTKSSSCLFEILFEEVGEETHTVDIPLSFGKFFQTLFRAIIAPNAP
jgi:flagellar biosynthesis component FlhA